MPKETPTFRSKPRRTYHRVWKGILGIRDLTKIRCGIWENKKYLDGIRDFTATRKAGFAKILGRDVGFCCLSVGNSGNRHDPNKRYGGKSESTKRAQNIHRKGQLLQKLVFFLCIFGKEKTKFGIAMKKVRDAGFSSKRSGNAGSGPPPSRPCYHPTT